MATSRAYREVSIKTHLPILLSLPMLNRCVNDLSSLHGGYKPGKDWNMLHVWPVGLSHIVGLTGHLSMSWNRQPHHEVRQSNQLWLWLQGWWKCYLPSLVPSFCPSPPLCLPHLLVSLTLLPWLLHHLLPSQMRVGSREDWCSSCGRQAPVLV